MTLLTYLQADLVNLMKRRDRIALDAARDAISAIQNAETSSVAPLTTAKASSEFVAGSVGFGDAEQVVASLTDPQMMAIARERVTWRLAEAVHYRELGAVDQALALEAEASALTEKLDAYSA